MKGVRNPESCKRPYLSIIKHLIKNKYNIYNSDTRLIINNETIRTTRYIFSRKKQI